MIQFLSSIFFISLMVVSLVTSDDSNVDVDSIQYRVFNIRAENLEPSETKNLLNQMQAAFKSGYTGKSSHLKDRVDRLVQACETTTTRCSDKHFDALNELGRKSSSYHSNVVLYLWYCKQEQYKICAEQQAPKIKEATSRLPKSTLREMKTLRQMVDDSKLSNVDARSSVPYANLDEAVANYVRLMVGPTVAEAINKGSDDGLDEYRRDVEKTLGSTCEPIKRELDPIMTSSYVPSADEEAELLRTLDGYSLRWIENYRICSKILNQIDILVDESFSRLSPRDSDDW